MKGGEVFKPGPVHSGGTRVFHRPGVATKAEVGTGLAYRSLVGGIAPDFAAGGAPCTRPGVDPDQFHPFGFAKADEQKAAETIATYCAPCPMRDTCLAWGRRVGRGTGIWGGVWFDALPRRRRGVA